MQPHCLIELNWQPFLDPCSSLLDQSKQAAVQSVAAMLDSASFPVVSPAQMSLLPGYEQKHRNHIFLHNIFNAFLPHHNSQLLMSQPVYQFGCVLLNQNYVCIVLFQCHFLYITGGRPNFFYLVVLNTLNKLPSPVPYLSPHPSLLRPCRFTNSITKMLFILFYPFEIYLFFIFHKQCSTGKGKRTH